MASPTGDSGPCLQRRHFADIFFIQTGDQVVHGFAGDGVRPVRRDIPQGQQDKAAIPQARVGQDQLFGGFRLLYLGRCVHPPLVCLQIGQNDARTIDQIKVQRARRPALPPVAAKRPLSFVSAETTAFTKSGPDSFGNAGVW